MLTILFNNKLLLLLSLYIYHNTLRLSTANCCFCLYFF
nr:MAG TPA: hypothetical protein [Caudoviricetes sp.]